MNNELQYQITTLLNLEAYLLDNKRYEEWLDLLTEDIVYRMPLRMTGETNSGSDIVEEMAFFEESKASLKTRVKRLRTTSAWAENPAPRSRHLITNIYIEPTSSTHELQVRSCFLFLRSRSSDLDIEHIFGERLDIIRQVNNEWKIAARTIYPDQTILTVKNLSMFL